MAEQRVEPTSDMTNVEESTKSSSIFEAVIFPLLLVGLVYFFGFSYLTAYFGFFGIKLAEINPSDKEVFVSGFYAVFNYLNFWSLGGFVRPIIVLTLIILFFVCLSFVGIRFLQMMTNRIFQTVAFALIIFVMHQVSMSAGVAAAQRDLLTLPEVMVVRADKESRLTTTTQAGEMQILSIETDRLIYANENSLFIYRQRDQFSTPVLIRLRKTDADIIFSPRSRGPGI